MPQIDEWSVQASATVQASAAEVFDWIARPANHVLLDGSGTVRGPLRPTQRLAKLGDAFFMRMNWFVPYLIRSKVSEFDEGRLIAWNHFARHRWRWEVAPIDDVTCTVTETFDASRAPIKSTYDRIGFPDAYQKALDESVAKVAAHFGS